jgi:S1-C subfamily serine protease
MSEPFAQNPYEQQLPIPEPPRKHRGRQALGLTATAVVALAAGAGAGIALSNGSSSATGSVASQTVLSSSQIAAKVDPGLVDVISTLGYQNAEAEGTGIVLTSNGEILTNNHVINGATSIKVTDIGNGQSYTATVVGYDDSQDVAVLQLSGASGLKTATIGNSSTVSVGNSVVGLGNAGGAGGTPSVAPGQVTALNQSITASDEGSGTSEQLSGLIESNADIQPGDSGGPLVNQFGAVVGMDTAASAGTSVGNGGSENGNGGFGGFGGFGSGDNGSSGNSGASGDSGSSSSSTGSATQGFSIPINTAISVADQIEAGDASSTIHIGTTAFLGIEIADTSTGSTGSTGTGIGTGGTSTGTAGVEIAGAVAGTPAAADGLTAGDVVTAVGGTSVDSGTAIQQVIENQHPGEKISVTWTDTSGQSHTATVTLANGPAD